MVGQQQQHQHDASYKRISNIVRSSITLAVLGDEGVGKSSLISSFLSRRFSPNVPGIMTRVRLPPEKPPYYYYGGGVGGGGGGTVNSGCVTTIVDTQHGDTALMTSVVVSGGGGRVTDGGDDNDEDFPTLAMKPPALVSLSGGSKVGGESSPNSSSSGGEMRSLGGGGAGIVSCGSGVMTAGVLEHLDAIVLVYDLGREETFDRLEGHWLPLIEQCYGEDVPVIITGNKMDLDSSSNVSISSQNNQRSRQRIVSLLQRFKSIRQSIKCSAKTLVNVNDVFLKAQHAVLYPINPLYDLSEGKLSNEAVKAFSRLFRIFDEDRDGLLSNDELKAFQRKCFRVPLMEGDLVGWKKVLQKNDANPDDGEKVIVDGKFTLKGFLTMFDVFINSNRLEIPWIILRFYGYDDDLRLCVPDTVLDGITPSSSYRTNKDVNSPLSSSWHLSHAAMEFLSETFQQFDHDNDGILTATELMTLFQICPHPSLPPWHPSRYITCQANLSSSSFPTDTSTPAAVAASATGVMPLSYDDWMSYWHMISVTCHPSMLRSELYYLGFTEPKPSKKKRAIATATVRRKVRVAHHLPQVVIRVAIFQHLPDTTRSSPYIWERFLPHNTTINAPCTNIRLKRHVHTIANADAAAEYVAHFVFVDVTDDANSTTTAYSVNDLNRFDLVLLAYNSSSLVSWETVRDVEERYLTDDCPRLFLAVHRVHEPDDNDAIQQLVMDHCVSTDLEPPLSISIRDDDDGGDDKDIENPTTTPRLLLEHLAKCAWGDLKARPHEEKRRKDAALRKKILWLGGLVSVSVAVVVGVKYLLGWKRDGPADSGSRHRSAGAGWFRGLLFGGRDGAAVNSGAERRWL